MTLESIFLLGRVLFPMELVNFLIALVGRTSLQEILFTGGLGVHKDFSAEMIYHFQWPGLYGVMSRFPQEPCKISGQQTLVRWYGKISKR